jgi:two-component system LytT family response regulator
MIKTIIVDDQHPDIKSLTTILNEHFKQIEIIATSENVPDAVIEIDTLKPQLVFLDIEMGNYSGFQLLEMVQDRDFEVIFTTAYKKYLIQALRVSALDFIYKPVNLEKLKEAVQRFKEKTGKARFENLLANMKLMGQEQKIGLPHSEGLKFFEIRKIIRCTSDNSYTDFYIIGMEKPFTVSIGIYEYEDLLSDKGFYRVHKEHLININHIKEYLDGEGGYLKMDDKSNESIPLARARKKDFFAFLKANKISV